MEVIQPTLAASLAIILYLVIEKIVAPLVKGKRSEILSGSPDEIARELVGRIRKKTGVI